MIGKIMWRLYLLSWVLIFAGAVFMIVVLGYDTYLMYLLWRSTQ